MRSNYFGLSHFLLWEQIFTNNWATGFCCKLNVSNSQDSSVVGCRTLSIHHISLWMCFVKWTYQEGGRSRTRSRTRKEEGQEQEFQMWFWISFQPSESLCFIPSGSSTPLHALCHDYISQQLALCTKMPLTQTEAGKMLCVIQRVQFARNKSWARFCFVSHNDHCWYGQTMGRQPSFDGFGTVR